MCVAGWHLRTRPGADWRGHRGGDIFRSRDHHQSRVMSSSTLLFPLAFLILLPFPLLGAWTRLLPSRLPALMMEFFCLLTSPPVFLPLLPSGAHALSHALGSASTVFFYTCFSFVTLDPWGASPFLFFSPLSPVFSIFSSSVSCPRVSSCSFPTPPIPPYASCVTSLSSSLPSSSRTMFCTMSFLSWNRLSLCFFV